MRGSKAFLGIIGALLFTVSASAQSVQQSGAITPNTAAIWNGTGIIKGGVSAADSPLTTFGVTRNGVDGICVSSDRSTAAGRNQLCFQASTAGPAKISLQSYGTATAQDLQFVLNGVTLTLPSGGGTFVTGIGPYTIGHAACFNSITGIIQDCGVSVGPGTANGLSYYTSASALGSTTAGTNGQALIGQTGAPPLWKTLSGDASSISAAGALTLQSVNGIPFNSSYTAHGVLLAQGSSAFTSAVTSNVGNCLLSQGTSSDPIWASCASGSGSAGGSNTQVQFNNSTALGGSANLTWVSPALTIGVAGTTTGQLQLAPAGSGTGTVTIQNPGTTAAYNFNLPTGAGTAGLPMLSGGGGGTPMSFGVLATAAGGTNCSVASGTCLDNITGFSSTGFVQRTGAGTYAFSTVIPVSGGGTGIANGNSGGILGFTGSGTIASSVALAQFGLLVGGGAGNTPTAITPGSAAQILLAQTSANPSWNTLSADATISASGALTIANSAVTLAKQANMAAFSLQGNFTGSSTAPQASTIPALSNKASPAAGDLIMISDSAAAGALKQATISSIASAGSVSSIAGNTGAFTLAGGVNNATNQIQFDGRYASLNTGHNCTLAASVASSLLTVALKDAGGNDPTATSPCYLNYRDPTAATGATTLVTQTAALSVATTNTGTAGSMGAPNAAAFRIWVVAFNNGGTNVLALINCTTQVGGNATVATLNEGVVASSTPFSASATAAGIFYTPSGVTVASKAFRILGYIEYNSSGLATAGTYATGPNFIQVFGPGIRKPGDRVQLVSSVTTTVGAATSVTYVALTTGLTQAITPTSAANIMRVEAQGSIVDTGAGAARIQLSRGSVAATNLFGSTSINGVAANSPTAAAVFGFDLPNTTSSTTYVVQGKATAGSVNFPYTTGDTAAILVEEIMG